MNEYPTELLILPAPKVVVVSDAPFLPALVGALSSCNRTALSTVSYGGTAMAAPQFNYEVREQVGSDCVVIQGRHWCGAMCAELHA
jgi:hypothetical protein